MHPIVRGYSFLCFFRDMLPTRSFMLFPWPSFCEERSTEVATGATSASRSGLFLPFPLVFSPGHPLLFFFFRGDAYLPFPFFSLLSRSPTTCVSPVRPVVALRFRSFVPAGASGPVRLSRPCPCGRRRCGHHPPGLAG
jgi:hypothetical protein